MRDTLNMEAVRIRTLRGVRIMGLAAVALGVVAAGFVAATPPQGGLTIGDTRLVLTGASSASLLPFVGLPVMFVGLAAVQEDTRYRLATVLLVAQPRRMVLIGARLTVLAALATAIGLAQATFSATASILLGRVPQFAAAPGILAPHLAELVLLAWVGAALGWLSSSPAVGVGAVLLDVLLLEPLAAVAGQAYSDSLEDFSGHLPFAAVRDAVGLDPFALALTLAYALAFLGAAVVAVRRRDY